MTQKITLTAFQNNKILALANQLNVLQKMQIELIEFIADAHGFRIDPAGKWNVNESILEIDVSQVNENSDGN
ncbi:MAG: hypothetical protein ACK47E_09450 [Cyclobacteriaceae bacterium]